MSVAEKKFHDTTGISEPVFNHCVKFVVSTLGEDRLMYSFVTNGDKSV